MQLSVIFSHVTAIGHNPSHQMYKGSIINQAIPITRASSTGDSLISGEVSYTGWMLSTGLAGSVQSLCPGVQMSAQDGS